MNYESDSTEIIDECDLLSTQIEHFSLFDKYTTCWGCINDRPDQLSHMDIGGCLFSYLFDGLSSYNDEDKDIIDTEPLSQD